MWRAFTSSSILLAVALFAGCDSGKSVENPNVSAVGPAKPNTQMQAILTELANLHPKPIETLSPEEARKQPNMSDAVKIVMSKNKMGESAKPDVTVENTVFATDQGSIPVRLYTPAEVLNAKPVIVYLHGGGWVIGSLDAYDASARALAKLCHAMVVSVDYRQAPEYTFPQAHEDAYAVTQYIIQNASKFDADANKVAIAGESAGGNMAGAVCLMAKMRGGRMPCHQLLVYPVTAHRTDSPSYQLNANAKPLNKAMMPWFFQTYLKDESNGKNPIFSILSAPDLSGLPPATVITAEIDPLQSDGHEYATKLKNAGIDVAYKDYAGVTHEFFGAAAVLDEAKNAQQFAADRLNKTFTQKGIMGVSRMTLDAMKLGATSAASATP